eukprot:14309304-Alexandrium_andersonii.AAC.1
MYGHTIPYVDPSRTGNPIMSEDIEALTNAQGEDADPFVWYTVPGIFTTSITEPTCPESPVSYTHLRAHETSAHL